LTRLTALQALARNASHQYEATLTGYVARTKGIGTGSTISSGEGGSELLALDENFFDGAFVEFVELGSDAGRAEQERDGYLVEAHLDG
jgi:hypothetical protein